MARPVRGRRLARRRGQVRPPAAGGLRPAGRRGAARLDRPHAERAVPVAVRAGRRRRCASSSSTARRRRRRRARRRRPRRASSAPLRHRPRRARPGGDARRVRRSATRSPTGRASSSPTRSRAGACRSPATRATTRRCSPPSRSTRCAPRTGLTAATEWDRFDPATPAGVLVPARAGGADPRRRASARCRHRPGDHAEPARRPSRSPPRRSSAGCSSSLARDEEVAPYLVTTAPDVATSTNLAGFINRTGVFAPTERRSLDRGPLLRWSGGPHRPAHRARHLAR